MSGSSNERGRKEPYADAWSDERGTLMMRRSHLVERCG